METIEIKVTKSPNGRYTVSTEHLGNGIIVAAHHPTHLSLAMVELRLTIQRYIKKNDSTNKVWLNLVKNWERINYDFKYPDPSHAPKIVNTTKSTYY